MANQIKFKYDVPGRLWEVYMYWQPTRLEGLRCSRGKNCDFGICDECQRTHNICCEEDNELEDAKTDDDSHSNHSNLFGVCDK